MVLFISRINKIKIIFPKEIYLVILGVLLGIILYYICDWGFLENITAKTVAHILCLTGHEAKVYENIIEIDNLSWIINDECTYVDWLLIAMPLVIGFSNKIVKRCAAAVILIMGWFFINTIRVWVAISLHSKGHSWFFSHELPAYFLWYFTLLMIILVWFKARARIVFN